jgi:hypothetical protein
LLVLCAVKALAGKTTYRDIQKQFTNKEMIIFSARNVEKDSTEMRI